MLIGLFCLCLLSVPAAAQDRAGRDTPGEWKVTHYTPFGLWDSICDERLTGTTLEERCYLRYVEVFAPHPKFAAQFAFVTLNGGPRIELGIERGTRFDQQGLRVESGGEPIWFTDRRDCLRGRACVFQATDAETLLSAMADGDVFAFDFVDRHGDGRSLRWDLTTFSAAIDDLTVESRRRGL